jgi:hypothetical protein
VKDDGTIASTSKRATDDPITLRLDPGRLVAIRVELLPESQASGKILRPGGSSGTLRLAAAIVRRGTNRQESLAFRAADADRVVSRFRNGFDILGILEGWKIDESIASVPLTGVWLLDRPVELGRGDTVRVNLSGNVAARVRVSVSPFAPGDLKHARNFETLAAALEKHDAAANAIVAAAYLSATAWNPDVFAKVIALEARIRECREGRTPVMVTVAVPPMETRLLPRGNWQDESGPILAPAIPGYLSKSKTRAGGARLTRLDLARWLVAPENPLTARVMVNRLWKQFFGAGLCGSVDDLGAQGEWPVHPELLDWLAAEFRDSGWDIKHIVTLIVNSHTYRQQSGLRPEVRETDPHNRLLSCQSPRRLDAEFVRDSALSIAGLIDLEVGGPPSWPYQPAEYYANIQFPDRDYFADSDERQYRRGVYTHWQRTFLHPMLAAFDSPSREDCVATRAQANSPQQALTLLNDPEFVEAARVLAAILLTSCPDDSSRIDLAYRRALARPALEKERRSLLELLAKVRATYRSSPDDAHKLLTIGIAPAPAGVDPSELAAWTQVCRVVLNLHETITRY